MKTVSQEGQSAAFGVCVCVCVGAGVEGCVAGSAAAELNGGDQWRKPLATFPLGFVPECSPISSKA